MAEQLPIIDVLCNQALRPRHWAAIQSAIAQAVSPEELTLSLPKFREL